MVVRGYGLEFTHQHSYPSNKAITVPIVLTSDANRRISLTAGLDTGSTYCIFERRYADWLGLDLEAGIPERIATATGSFHCYGHEVALWVSDLEWEAVVYFAEPEAFDINVVGRVGFLDRLQVGIVDYEQLLYLGLYDQQ